MLRLRLSSPVHPAGLRPRPRGRVPGAAALALALVAVVLAGSGGLARAFWLDAPLGPDLAETAPRIWIASLIVPDPPALHDPADLPPALGPRRAPPASPDRTEAATGRPAGARFDLRAGEVPAVAHALGTGPGTDPATDPATAAASWPVARTSPAPTDPRAEGPTPPQAAPPAGLADLAPRRSPPPPARRPTPPTPTQAPALLASPAPASLAPRLSAPPVRPETVSRRATPPGAATAALAAVETAGPALAPALAASATCPTTLTRAIPRRPAGAPGGRSVLSALGSAGGTARDGAILRELERGNLPDHLRNLVPVTLSGTTSTGQGARITLCVMPDYLAVGQDRDFVRVPMGLPAATRIAARFDMALPTPPMVDAIHRQATTRLPPAPMTPGAQMASTDYVLRHNATIEGQRQGRGALGHLVSGHKKDLVLTNRLTRTPGRVAIYGWHRADGRPIQPLSTVHGRNYADYSHGVRLIAQTAYVDGRPMDLSTLLADRRYAAILTGDDGPIATRQLLAALR